MDTREFGLIDLSVCVRVWLCHPWLCHPLSFLFFYSSIVSVACFFVLLFYVNLGFITFGYKKDFALYSVFSEFGQ